ncbi:hypothetical protein PENARI_c013G05149 [Penicillium arizonense]|uniref:Uncharacterized protein n=1 Tax=Penicillium arizonense TaxID=1835702 RepID=A0A1F5L120_PENAI|nr:hypothetical protein PENARI_c150G03501 [Penicillium arizonense]XP_022482415.1 hypothetical protein PENARI_c084G05019 [Penicillium arizonense]XP_022486778.1 hypothetical protein PENARI_c013G05149 [Penicillium arizonense]OGE46655.1 hypothetical protein PENARI_c150G03501 [Penicillium arizonense]OGE46948.1 hypothetical protein PENARI_c084G05019 [Penicillium arizonense]OGE51333.1 hypothetical protein PENARI_c013G05149 [Penicillium arizonense]
MPEERSYGPMLLWCFTSVKFFQCYRQQAHPYMPDVLGIDEFERELCTFLEEPTRDMQSGFRTGKPFDWLGLLFAILAFGVQVSDLSYKERIRLSQAFSKPHRIRMNGFRPTIAHP